MYKLKKIVKWKVLDERQNKYLTYPWPKNIRNMFMAYNKPINNVTVKKKKNMALQWSY